MPVKAVFLDTGFAIALASPRDRYHARAVQLADELKTSGSAIITTRAVLLEIGAALANGSRRDIALWAITRKNPLSRSGCFHHQHVGKRPRCRNCSFAG